MELEKQVVLRDLGARIALRALQVEATPPVTPITMMVYSNTFSHRRTSLGRPEILSVSSR